MVICLTSPGGILPEANKSTLEIYFEAKVNIVFEATW